jgi:Zn-dependent protease
MWRFRLFGIPVRVEPWFWLIGLILGASRLDSNLKIGTTLLIIWMVIWFVSILIHELGHAFFQRRFRGRPEIVLHGCGGVAIGNGFFNRWESLIISAAGPVVQITAGVLAWWALDALEPSSPAGASGLPESPRAPGRIYLAHALLSFGWISVVWGLFNLLPVIPLDGGHVFDALTGGKTRLVAGVGMVAGAAVTIYLALGGSLIFALILGYFTWRNYETWRRGYRSQSAFGDV